MKDALSTIIEESADGFLILDRDRRVVFLNDVLSSVIGLRKGDVLPPNGPLLRGLGLDGVALPFDTEAVITDRQGNPRRFLVSALSVESASGPIVMARLRAAPSRAPADSFRRRDPFQQLFRTIGDPIIAANLDGSITLANPPFYRLIGWDESEPLPNIGAVYAHPPELEDKILRLTEADMVYNLETHLSTKGRQLRRVLDTSWVMRDERGVVTGYTTHFKDVTYVKNLEVRLRISERNYMLLFDTILSSVIIVDPRGRLLNCNYYAEKMYGWRRAELVGRDFDEVFQAHDKSLVIRQVAAQVDRNRGRYVETDVPRRCRDGAVKFTYASYSALRSSTGETIAYTVMELDLTERVRLEKKLRASLEQIKDTQSAAILGFARLTEYRDVDAGKHLERIREYTRVLATALARLPKYADYLTEEYIEDLCLSCVLHDVGKVGIEDALLQKRGRLNPREFEKIKLNATLGGEALRAVDEEINRESFLTLGKEIAFYHHERWDGTGYPSGKKGNRSLCRPVSWRWPTSTMPFPPAARTRRRCRMGRRSGSSSRRKGLISIPASWRRSSRTRRRSRGSTCPNSRGIRRASWS